MILAGTGHRPDRLGGYHESARERLRGFLVSQLRRLKPERVLSGMAVGFDQALASAAVELSIPFDAIVPFLGQQKFWPKAAKEEYATLIDMARNVVIVSPGGYAPEKMRKRNEYLVDHSDQLLALWNGSMSGTGHCVAYAERRGKVVHKLWDEWKEFRNAA